jgi:hypothetical protein
MGLYWYALVTHFFLRQNFEGLYLKLFLGCAVAQAVSRWLPLAGARVRARAACGVCGGQSGQVFSEYFGFPCQSSFHQLLHRHNHPRLAQ